MCGYFLKNPRLFTQSPIRVSLVAHSRVKTVIYLKISDSGNVQTRQGPGGTRTLQYPPGSESDRVSMVMYRCNGSTGYTIDDVRGIRWDRNGREYFTFTKPVVPGRMRHSLATNGHGTVRAAADATERLTQILRTTPAPSGFWASNYDIWRFRQLNRCESCHWPEKRGARMLYDRGPPWATDASGLLYTPLAVMHHYAPLSAQSAFHDPNSNDPYIQAHCGSHTGPTNAERQGSPGGYYYRCPDGAYPIGVRDLSRALRQRDRYSQSVCNARRYLYRLLDADGKRYFARQSCAFATDRAENDEALH